MTSKLNDPLLLAGKVIAIFLQAAMALAAAALAVAIPTLVIFRDRADAAFSEEVGRAADLPIASIAGLMLVGLVLVCLLFVFFGRLRKIIATVGEGDPFQPENAERLSQMGWLMLACQLLAIPAVPLGMHLAHFFSQFREMEFKMDSDLDISGILLTIILFILARVFRHGAAMREDLEGTV
jgi:hypothetical protein